jgi:hypothetical protein
LNLISKQPAAALSKELQSKAKRRENLMKFKEVTAANADDFKDGELRQVSASGTDILLARVKGCFHAVGATCPQGWFGNCALSVRDGRRTQ